MTWLLAARQSAVCSIRLVEMSRNSRILFAVFGRPFFRRLALPLGLLLLGVSQADATVNWAGLRTHLEKSAAWQVTLLFTILFVSWSITAGRALGAVWRQPVIAFLVRQPMSRWQWVRYLAPSLFVAFLPIAGIWWLAPHHANTIAHYSGFVGLAWPIMLGASYRGRCAAKWIAIGASALAVLIFGYTSHPVVAYVALVTTVFLIPLSVSEIPDQVAASSHITSRRLASARPTFAIVRRDLVYMWRMEQNSLFGLAGLGVVASLMMFALRFNGHVAGREAFVYACGLLSLAVLPTYEILERTKRGLGREFMRRRWPINHRDRGVALLCVMFVLTGPSVIAIGTLGSTMGTVYIILFILWVYAESCGQIRVQAKCNPLKSGRCSEILAWRKAVRFWFERQTSRASTS
ncbi:MAG: hypothetical protein ACREQ8_00770 [Woeseiaceae bacterium]